MDPLLSRVPSKQAPRSVVRSGDPQPSYGSTQWSSKVSSLNNPPPPEKAPHTVHDITGSSQISHEEDYKPKASQTPITKVRPSTTTAVLDMPHGDREVDEGHNEKRQTPIQIVEYYSQPHVCNAAKKTSRREGDITQGKFARLDMVCRETASHPASIALRVFHAMWCFTGILLGVTLCDDCPNNQKLPLCIIVGDSAWLLLAVIHLCCHRYENSLFLQFGSTLFSTFICVWYSLVFYWVVMAMTTPCKDALLWVVLIDALFSLLCLISMVLLLFVVIRQSEESERRMRESSTGTRLSKEKSSAETLETNKSRSVDPRSPAPLKDDHKVEKTAHEKRSSGEHDRRKDVDLPIDKTGPSTEGSHETPNPKQKTKSTEKSKEPQSTQHMTNESKEKAKGSIEKPKTKSGEKSTEVVKKRSGESTLHSKETAKSTEH